MSSTWTAGSDGKGPRRGRWPSRARSPSSGVRIRIDGDVMMPVCRVRNPLVKSCVSAGKSRLDQERGNSCNSHSNDTAHGHGPVPKIRWTTPAIDAPSRRKHNRCASGWQLGVPSICPAVVQRAQLLVEPVVHDRLRAGFAAAAAITGRWALPGAEAGLPAIRARIWVSQQASVVQAIPESGTPARRRATAFADRSRRRAVDERLTR